MTFFAQAAPGGKRVVVNVTYGPISIKVDEDPGHLRNFHAELGTLLSTIETPEAGQ